MTALPHQALTLSIWLAWSSQPQRLQHHAMNYGSDKQVLNVYLAINAGNELFRWRGASQSTYDARR